MTKKDAYRFRKTFQIGDVEGAEEQNPTDNRTFADILNARISRRDTMKGGLGVAAVGFLSPIVNTGCGNDSDGSIPDEVQTELGFTAIPADISPAVTLPAGYRATVLFAYGDPINESTPEFRNDGTDDPDSYQFRSGTGHDGMFYFPLPEFDSRNSDRGLLCINHENIFIQRALHEERTEFDEESQTTFFTGGPSVEADGNRPVGEVTRELFAHGVSVIEVERDENGDFQVVRGSSFNRRIHANTEMELAGPVRGSELTRTVFSPDGTRTRGTLNNCANGYTAWGTYLTCEENWHGYFRTDEEERPRSKSRYGVDSTSNYRWETAGSEGIYRRFETTPSGASATEDYRNEANTYGWIVEIDPYDPNSTPVKRTTMGRFRHEGCWPSPAIPGQRLAFYSGDDAINEYIYKFVTAEEYQRGATGLDASLLDSGTLYVARFNDDGTGEWLELSMSNPALASEFSDMADLLVNTRAAADLLGATPMDRPEWGAVNPANGEVYMTLTNNSTRVAGNPEEGQTAVDPANPRAYDSDDDGDPNGNRNGHIIRWREDNDDVAATSFTWDIFLFGSRAGNRPENLSNLDESNAFASPDGLFFDVRTNRGVCWIQTDDSSLRDFTDNQMLAALPGVVGDGSAVTSDQGQSTFVGAELSPDQLKRFLTGPTGCEITGVDVTPDGTAMFINVQHPGGEGNRELSNNWPLQGGLATDTPNAVGNLARPRPATIVITRIDGGVIGA